MGHEELSYSLIHDRLNSVLEERDRLYPIRDETNTAQMWESIDLLAGYLAGRRKDLPWDPDENLVDISREMTENAVFICGPMKSGTTLFLELLDGHSELNVLPGDSWVWTRFSDEAEQEVFSPEAWRKHWLQRFVNPTGQKPFWIFGEEEQAYLFLLNYIDFWLAILPDNQRRPVLAAVFSFFCANPRHSLRAKKWVEKTPGNELKVDALSKHFPQARFVHLVRDPRENFASIKRLYRSRKWAWDARGMARSLAESYDAAAANLERFGPDRYLVVRYDKLTAAPEDVMRNVAAFLGIAWNDSLLVPTINTLIAKANTMYEDRQAEGVVRRSTSDKWRQELSSFEQGLVHQTRKPAGKVGCSWTMTPLDHCKKLLFGWSAAIR